MKWLPVLPRWLRWLPRLPHRHWAAERPGVGTFRICRYDVAFRPDLDGAGWHHVPSHATYAVMLAASSPEQAMACLRLEWL